MARLPRVVIPGVPHHVTQRGNRRERTFFEEGDYALYLDLLADAAARAYRGLVLPGFPPSLEQLPQNEDGRGKRDGHECQEHKPSR